MGDLPEQVSEVEIIHNDRLYIISKNGYEHICEQVDKWYKDGYATESKRCSHILTEAPSRTYIYTCVINDPSVVHLTPNASHIRYARVTWKEVHRFTETAPIEDRNPRKHRPECARR